MKTLFISLLFPILIFGRNSSRAINIDVSIKPIQKLILLNSQQFLNLDVNHLDKGYNELEDCVELEVKSNVPWALVAYDDSYIKQTNNTYKIRIDNNPYMSLTHSEILLTQGNSPTPSEIINIDCKRLVSWNTTKPGQWEFTPLFKLIPLTENWINGQ